jgi:hypothetical protein
LGLSIVETMPELLDCVWLLDIVELLIVTDEDNTDEEITEEEITDEDMTVEESSTEDDVPEDET